MHPPERFSDSQYPRDRHDAEAQGALHGAFLGGSIRQRTCDWLSIVAWPLENGEPKKGWRPGTDTDQDIRPGSVLSRKYEDRQRKPDDLEAQEGQRTIAVHALENLAPSDTGIALLRRTLREQIKRVSDGLDPMNVMRDERLNRTIPTNAWNTILSPTEVSVLQGEEVSRRI